MFAIAHRPQINPPVGFVLSKDLFHHSNKCSKTMQLTAGGTFRLKILFYPHGGISFSNVHQLYLPIARRYEITITDELAVLTLLLRAMEDFCLLCQTLFGHYEFSPSNGSTLGQVVCLVFYMVCQASIIKFFPINSQQFPN